MQVFMSAEVLGALAGTLFPKPANSSQDSSGASTPADEVKLMTSTFLTEYLYNLLLVKFYCFSKNQY